MAEYTAPAIAGSVEVWKDVAATSSWRGDDQEAGHALYRQIRRAVGLSLAGITGTIKNSAQAMLKRLRQDGYTELVAGAVLTAPQPPRKTMLRQAISRRGLTPATPN